MVRNKIQFEPLVMEMLDGFNQKHIHGTFLDPFAGTGQFVSVVEEQKRVAGLSDEEIHATTFGFFKTSIAMNNAKKTHKLVGQYEVLTESDLVAIFSVNDLNYLPHGKYTTKSKIRLQAIKDDIIMKFDVIAGNPPFQATKEDGTRSDQASNLWAPFWSITLSKLSKEDGIVALISPTSWVSPSSDIRGVYKIDGVNRLWDIFNKYTSYANIKDVAKFFSGVGSTFGYVIVDKSSSNGLVFSDNTNTSLGFLPLSNFDEVAQELTKLGSNDSNLGNNFTVNQNNTPDLRVSFPISRTVAEESIEILDGVAKPTTGSPKEKLYIYIHVKNMDQALQVKNRITTCISILNKYCKYAGFINIQTVKSITYDNTR